MPATVGWEVSATRAVYFCRTCACFHIATHTDTDHSRGSCPRLPEGAPITILLCGPTPESILWAIHNGFVGPQARRELREAYQTLAGVLGASSQAAAV